MERHYKIVSGDIDERAKLKRVYETKGEIRMEKYTARRFSDQQYIELNKSMMIDRLLSLRSEREVTKILESSDDAELTRMGCENNRLKCIPLEKARSKIASGESQWVYVDGLAETLPFLYYSNDNGNNYHNDSSDNLSFDEIDENGKKIADGNGNIEDVTLVAYMGLSDSVSDRANFIGIPFKSLKYKLKKGFKLNESDLNKMIEALYNYEKSVATRRQANTDAIINSLLLSNKQLKDFINQKLKSIFPDEGRLGELIKSYPILAKMLTQGEEIDVLCNFFIYLCLSMFLLASNKNDLTRLYYFMVADSEFTKQFRPGRSDRNRIEKVFKTKL